MSAWIGRGPGGRGRVVHRSRLSRRVRPDRSPHASALIGLFLLSPVLLAAKPGSGVSASAGQLERKLPSDEHERTSRLSSGILGKNPARIRGEHAAYASQHRVARVRRWKYHSVRMIDMVAA
jgi:hypothetical protein